MTAGDFRYAAKQIAFAGVALIILVFTSVLSLKADQDLGGRRLSRWR